MRKTSDIETVTDKQMTNYAKTLERKRLNRCGNSPTYGTIGRAANSFIVEIQTDVILVRAGWREAMRAAVEA